MEDPHHLKGSCNAVRKGW